jgi:NADH-quinone oxidoreductase subunit N
MSVTFAITDLWTIFPELLLIAVAIVVIAVDIVWDKKARLAVLAITLVGYVAALISVFALSTFRGFGFSNMVVRDPFTLFFEVVIIGAAILTALLSSGYIEQKRMAIGEYYALHIFATVGCMLVAASSDLISIFVGIELLSISVYILTGFIRRDARSNEGALKYFLLGIFATAILVYGMSWLYGLTGTTNLAGIATYISGLNRFSPVLLLAMLLVVAGLGFKIAAVPFHMWTPEAYEGAPTPISAFMSIAPKAAAFAALVRVLVQGLLPMQIEWAYLIAALAVVTMTLGNVVAISQKNVKRMLAYSSIAHTGYILVGLAAYTNGSTFPIQSILFYFFVYMFMNTAAFGVIVWLERHNGGETLDSFAGLAGMAAVPALIMAIAMFSLTGIPPTAGFWGKYYIFLAAVQSGWTWLAVILVINSAISAFFYLRVVVQMYVREPLVQVASPKTTLITAALIISGLAVLVIFIYPAPALQLAQLAAGF